MGGGRDLLVALGDRLARAGQQGAHLRPRPGQRRLVEKAPHRQLAAVLADHPGAIGGKTGFTDAARKTYVGAADRDGRRLVIAMMYGLVHEGGPTYWDQATALLDWGFAQSRSESVAAL